MLTSVFSSLVKGRSMFIASNARLNPTTVYSLSKCDIIDHQCILHLIVVIAAINTHTHLLVTRSAIFINVGGSTPVLVTLPQILGVVDIKSLTYCMYSVGRQPQSVRVKTTELWPATQSFGRSWTY